MGSPNLDPVHIRFEGRSLGLAGEKFLFLRLERIPLRQVIRPGRQSSGCESFAEGLGGPETYGITKAALNALTVRLTAELPLAGDVAGRRPDRRGLPRPPEDRMVRGTWKSVPPLARVARGRHSLTSRFWLIALPTSHRRIVPSSLAEASSLPSGENARPCTLAVCSDNFAR
jgi:hypothetical protein